MQLNIKDPETHALVTRLSQATGVSLARAVKDAVRDKLAELERAKADDVARRIAEVHEIVASIRARLPEKLPTQAEMDGWFYDEDGLPK